MAASSTPSSSKRPRLTDGDAAPAAAPAKPRPHVARLFQPFRALGFITNHVPSHLIVRHGGKDATRPDVNILTCIGNSWALWDAERITLLFVGEPLKQPIEDLAVSQGAGRDGVLAASGANVYRFERGRIVDVYETAADRLGGFDDDSDSDDDEAAGVNLSQLCTFGDYLAALTSDGRSLYVWSLTRRSLLKRIDLGSDFAASSILHPSTYIDKVILGSQQGGMQLWNLRSGERLHSFDAAALRRAARAPEGSSSPIVAIEQTPAIDVVAIAWEDGHVLLHDARYDEPILCAQAVRGGGLARGCLAFRTDGRGHTLALGTRAGNISLFDLDAASTSNASAQTIVLGPNGAEVDGGASAGTQLGIARPARLAHTIRGAHASGVSSLRFVPGQPLLISSGHDNCVKQWFFESLDGTGYLGGGEGGAAAAAGNSATARLLKSREGHSAPPRLVRYYGEDGRTLLTAGGEDRSVRIVSVVRESRSTELSQGSLVSKSNKLSIPLVSLKLPPASSLSFSTTRSRDWDDVLTSHEGQRASQTWSVREKRMSKKPLTQPSGAPTTVTHVSACGNFGLVGDAEGRTEMFNMQSGMHRRSFDTRPLLASEKTAIGKKGKKTKRGKSAPVTGVATDAANRIAVIALQDGRLFFFDFHTAEQLQVVSTGSGISSILLDRSTNLLATTHDDLSLRLYDIETRRLVRHFVGFRGRILDVTFSNDGRWLLASSLDRFIRTFDIPSARLVDAFRAESAATSISFSPTGDFLATTHVGRLGVYLWANRAQFSSVPLKGIDEEEDVWREGVDEDAPLPAVQREVAEVGDADEGPVALVEDDQEDEDALNSGTYTSPVQLTLKMDSPSSSEQALITFSNMPRSRWLTLLNLDVIKSRDRPAEAPKKPERAPFFLPQVADGPQGARFDIAEKGEEGGKEVAEGEKGKRILMAANRDGGVQIQSEFARRMIKAEEDKDYEGFFLYLDTLSPPALDLELRSLSLTSEHACFLRLLTARLRQGRDFEAVQALLNVFARVHGETIIGVGAGVGDGLGGGGGDGFGMMDEEGEDDVVKDESKAEIRLAVRDALVALHEEGERLMGLVEYCLGTISFVRDVPLA